MSNSSTIAAIKTGTALFELFSKFGFEDGAYEKAEEINKKFAEHLNSKGFDCGTLATPHNPRVGSIKINGEVYLTDNLMWGPPDWKLTRTLADGSDEEIPVPKDLEKAILEFVPVVIKYLDKNPIKPI